MHISLDSALGQQRRLNQVGETISSIAAPTAAYSLRSLTGGDPKAVRVRRESDNHEQDFTVSEVSSGALVNFVNAQVTAPLDIQELDPSPPPGRTANFLIAKAAYSLRSLGTRQATVAATGDTVSRANGKYVCQVRSVTGDIKSFTADEVSDGTLVDFVLGNTKSLLNSRAYLDGSNDEIVLTSEITMSGDFSIQYSFVITESGERILGRTTTYFIAAEGSGEIDKFKAQVGSSNNTMTLTSNLKYGEENTIKFKRVSGKIGIYNESDTLISNEVTASGDFAVNSFGRARGQYAKGVIYNIRIDTNNDGTINHSYNGYGNTLSDWQDLVGSNNASAVNGSPALFTGQDQDGFVKTWYDQSVSDQAGNTATGNHATQSTAANQPKIVSDGALNTNGGLLFDGIDDKLGFTALDTANAAMFSVLRFNDVSGTKQVLGSNGGDGTFGIDDEDTFKYSDNSGSEDGDLNATITTSSDFLYSGLKSSSGNTISFFTNGIASEVKTIAGSVESDTIGGPNNHLSANLKEIVIYNTDQTDNRTAIEANMGEHYSIDLPSGVDPGFDQVNGFVSTWYDQSGNGNNATQGTASKQPKIVNAGSLISDGILFGANINLPLSGTGLDIFKNVSHGNIFSVLKPLDTGTSGDRYFSAGINTGTNARFLFADSQDTNASFRIGGRALDSDSFSDEEGTTTHSNAVSLLTGFIDYENTTATLFLNGTQINTATLANMSASGSTSNTSSALAAIGDLQSSGALTSDFNAKEMIIYNTNQSSNRTALETNIKSHYGIS